MTLRLSPALVVILVGAAVFTLTDPSDVTNGRCLSVLVLAAFVAELANCIAEGAARCREHADSEHGGKVP